MENKFYDLPHRIANAFPEIDNDIIVDLKTNNIEYMELHKRLTDMRTDNLFIFTLFESDAAVSISAEEHKVLLEYFSLQVKIGDMEREKIYFRGHTDNFAYLKKINVI